MGYTSTTELPQQRKRAALRFRAGSEEVLQMLDALAVRGMRSRPAQVEWLIREEAIRQGLVPPQLQEPKA